MHAGNIAFTLPDINSWPPEEVLAAFGEPKKVPFDRVYIEPACFSKYTQVSGGGSGDEQEQSQPAIPTRNQPQYLVAPASISNLWALCTSTSDSTLPNIRIIDFTESFRTPLPTGHPLPGTPACIAPPELLLSLPSEVGTSIDVWTFACTAYELLGEGAFFTIMFGTASEALANMIVVLGGKDKCPERFWNEFREKHRGQQWFDEDGKVIAKMLEGAWSWEDRVGFVRGDGGCPEEDKAVLRNILNGGIVFEPKERATAAEIVQMLPREWEQGAFSKNTDSSRTPGNQEV